MDKRKIVFVNQAVNFLTVDIVNSFAEKFDDITLITGNVHTQGTALHPKVKIDKLVKYNDRNFRTKTFSWIMATAQFFFKALFKYRRHEIFFVSIPPMAYLCMLLLPNRFSILVWDVYPDTLKVYGIGDKNPLFRFWSWANKKLFVKATHIFTIGERMADLVSEYIDRSTIKIIRLWTTFENFEPVSREDNFFIKEHSLQDKYVVQYSGNIGLIHNVEVMVDIAAAMKDNSKVFFLIIGRGNKVNEIKESIEKNKLTNCLVLPFQPDNVFPYSLSAADLGVVILDSKTSKGSIPNKTYNLMTAGKPVLYIASSDSELHIYAERYDNGKCFDAAEVQQMAAFIEQLSRDTNRQAYYKERSLQAAQDFTRKNTRVIIQEYEPV